MNIRSHPLSRRNRVRGLAVTAALALTPVLALAVSGSAQASALAPAVSWSSPAAATLPSCPNATLCTFQNAEYQGTRWNYAYNNRPHATWFYVGSAANDQISSFYNSRAWTSYFARACPVTSQWVSSDGGGSVPNLNDGHHTWPNGDPANDSISAIGFGTSTGVSEPAHATDCP